MEIALTVAGLVLAVIFGVIPLGQWISGELTRVRSAVRAAEPRIDCTIGTYGGAGSGLHATVHNSGDVRAHNLSLTVPTMDVAWHQDFLERGDWVRQHQIPIADDAPLRTTRIDNPIAVLTYHDQYGLAYALKITLTQTPRDDRRFNLGSRPGGTVDRPAFTQRQLWRLRKDV